MTAKAQEQSARQLAARPPSRALSSVPALGQNDLCPLGFARLVQRMREFEICLRHDRSVPPQKGDLDNIRYHQAVLSHRSREIVGMDVNDVAQRGQFGEDTLEIVELYPVKEIKEIVKFDHHDSETTQYAIGRLLEHCVLASFNVHLQQKIVLIPIWNIFSDPCLQRNEMAMILGAQKHLVKNELAQGSRRVIDRIVRQI